MNNMRTRKGGGTCSTQYCTYDDLETVSFRIYNNYLKSIGAIETRDTKVRKMPTNEDIMKLVKEDCSLKNGDSVCLGLPYFKKVQNKRGELVNSDTLIYLKKHKFSDILTSVMDRIKEFLSKDKFEARVKYMETLKAFSQSIGSGPIKTRKRPKKRNTRKF